MTTKITAMAVVLAIAGMVQANTVTYTDTVTTPGGYQPGDTISVTVPQFDNTVAGKNGDQVGAILTGVTLSLVTAQESANFNFLNNDGGPEAIKVTLYGGTITFGNGTKDTVTTLSYVNTFNDVPTGSSSIPNVQTGTGSSINPFGTGLSSFEGSGNVGSMTIAFAGAFGGQGWTSGSFGTDGFGGAAEWSVTYDYSPIPEPCSMALFGVGAGVLALRRRFGKNKKA